MSKENKSQELTLKNIEKTINYFIEEIDQNELMSKKHEKVCKTLRYRTLSYLSFCSYWMCFNFSFYFFSFYFYKN